MRMEIPEQYKYAVIPHIMVEGAAEAITFYAAAFGASELSRLEGKDGRVMHAEIRIQGSALMLGDAHQPFSPPGSAGASA
jgi:PhnB protein